MNCIYCSGDCIKRGKRKDIQSYQCKTCRKYQQENYRKNRIQEETYIWVQRLNNEGCGISSMSRLLDISKSSVLRVIKNQKNQLKKPEIKENNQNYEIDEIKTYCGSKEKETWLIYAINRKSKQVIDFIVGRRTKENIKKVIDSILTLNPRHIYTDKLNIYKSLLTADQHRYYRRCTNHIERMNLTIRTQLKPFNRKTIGFTRSETMLYHKFYLWAYSIKM